MGEFQQTQQLAVPERCTEAARCVLLSACGVELPARSWWVRLGQGKAELSSVYFIFIFIFILITITTSVLANIGRAKENAYR